MTPKPTLADGQAKLQRWADERSSRNATPILDQGHTRPRGNGDRDERDLKRGIERLETLVGR